MGKRSGHHFSPASHQRSQYQHWIHSPGMSDQEEPSSCYWAAEEMTIAMDAVMPADASGQMMTREPSSFTRILSQLSKKRSRLKALLQLKRKAHLRGKAKKFLLEYLKSSHI